MIRLCLREEYAAKEGEEREREGGRTLSSFGPLETLSKVDRVGKLDFLSTRDINRSVGVV